MHAPPDPSPARSRAAQFTPELVTVLREGYGAAAFRADLFAGLTVAVVALPLSMAIAIASGLSPDKGLITAIVGGFLVSLLGGSRVQIGGPAGAFIVLVSATVMQHGLEGLILATFMSGFFLFALGALRLGTLVRYIPYPVTIGFTAGIGVIILASQIRPFLGLTLEEAEPGPILEKLPVLAAAAGTITPAAVALGVATILVIVGIRRAAPKLPGMLVAVALAAVSVWALGLPVATIGSTFGDLARGLPAPALPDLSPALMLAVLPDALAFTLLGAIESLLSAVVADGMTGRRHKSNTELMAQGVANAGSALFGGFCVTGTIARTATNARAGAHGPVAGMIHAVTLLGFLMLFAPLAAFIPLAALAGVLVTVAWHMVDPRAILALWRVSRAEAAVLFVTLALTVLRDLTEAIVAGVALGSLLFIQRMAKLSEVTPVEPPAASGSGDPDTLVLRLTGAYFFGSAPMFDTVLDRIAARPGHVVLDLSAVPVMDTTGAHSIAGMARRLIGQDRRVSLAGVAPAHRRVLEDALRDEGVAGRVNVTGTGEAG